MRAASDISPNPAPLLPRYSAVCRAVGPLRLQSKMRTIIVKLPSGANFSSEMAEMRVWLDKHRCSPSRFKYHLVQESVIMQVEFNEDEEAEVFERYFDGRKAI
jgi:hypothetical protein